MFLSGDAPSYRCKLCVTSPSFPDYLKVFSSLCLFSVAVLGLRCCTCFPPVVVCRRLAAGPSSLRSTALEHRQALQLRCPALVALGRVGPSRTRGSGLCLPCPRSDFSALGHQGAPSLRLQYPQLGHHLGFCVCICVLLRAL